MEVTCLNCKVLFDKESFHIKRSPNHFCSRSCSATYNNKGKRKNPPILRKCKKCKENYFLKRAISSVNFCQKCFLNFESIKDSYKALTLQHYQEKMSVKNKHPSWISAHVRQFNRSWNRDLIQKGCLVCGYIKHVELAHIKPISKFEKTTLLGEINSPSNVIPLCPNHHWEFDNNHLTINQILNLHPIPG